MIFVPKHTSTSPRRHHSLFHLCLVSFLFTSLPPYIKLQASLQKILEPLFLTRQIYTAPLCSRGHDEARVIITRPPGPISGANMISGDSPNPLGRRSRPMSRASWAASRSQPGRLQAPVSEARRPGSLEIDH